MKLDKIITLANADVRLQFLAMERSLRASGSDLPILVIPYDNKRFELPENSSWWEMTDLINWLDKNKSHPMMRKYQALLSSNYQFVDTDICFLRDPANALQSEKGFVVCCGHWHNLAHACNDQCVKIMSAKCTTWQKKLFNAGQFAADRALYSLETLQDIASNPDYIETILRWPHNDQPGMNLLVWLSKVPFTNLTLPPAVLQSSWAGDYPASYLDYWENSSKQPYIIHWAGLRPDGSRPIDRIFFEFLTKSEKEEWLNLNAGKSTTQKNIIKRVNTKLTKALFPV